MGGGVFLDTLYILSVLIVAHRCCWLSWGDQLLSCHKRSLQFLLSSYASRWWM